MLSLSDYEIRKHRGVIFLDNCWLYLGSATKKCELCNQCFLFQTTKLVNTEVWYFLDYCLMHWNSHFFAAVNEHVRYFVNILFFSLLKWCDFCTRNLFRQFHWSSKQCTCSGTTIVIVFTMCRSGCETPPLKEILLEEISTSKCVNSPFMK